jgi:glycosyltransferase involved in cell wall biosynthesis
MYVALTRDLTIAAFAGPHYVEWAKRKGLSNALFITTPVADPLGAAWENARASKPANGKCRILMIGHLHSTSNKSGLPIFFNEVLPCLEKIWNADEFEIHIVGRNDAMPRRFDSWRDHPSLKFRGPVSPAEDEFLRADILLVTVPAETGSRVRIINGFSYGCCIVAHTANALGIPELKHNENALLADTGAGLAREIVRAAQDPELRKRLGRNGRMTYEQSYTERAGGEQYLQYIERAVREAQAR